MTIYIFSFLFGAVNLVDYFSCFVGIISKKPCCIVIAEK